jgi:nucleoside-diphosphate-sugar epimerase
VVLLSSLAALGPCRDSAPLDAETLPCPLSHYGQSKLLAEAAVHAYADRVPAVILRFSAVYGPRERGVLQFFRMVARGLALTTGSWDREVSMIYVADAVEALICAARAPGAVGRTFCVAHPDPVSWGGFADATAEALGRRPLRIALPVPLAQLVAVVAECTALIAGRPALLNREKLRELVQQRWVCDVTRAIRELRFEPAWPVIRGTASTAAWYRAARWL